MYSKEKCDIGCVLNGREFGQFYQGSLTQIGKFAECAGDLSFVQIACAAVFVSLNNSSIVSFCSFMKFCG